MSDLGLTLAFSCSISWENEPIIYKRNKHRRETPREPSESLHSKSRKRRAEQRQRTNQPHSMMNQRQTYRAAGREPRTSLNYRRERVSHARIKHSTRPSLDQTNTTPHFIQHTKHATPRTATCLSRLLSVLLTKSHREQIVVDLVVIVAASLAPVPQLKRQPSGAETPVGGAGSSLGEKAKHAKQKDQGGVKKHACTLQELHQLLHSSSVHAPPKRAPQAPRVKARSSRIV